MRSASRSTGVSKSAFATRFDDVIRDGGEARAAAASMPQTTAPTPVPRMRLLFRFMRTELLSGQWLLSETRVTRRRRTTTTPAVPIANTPRTVAAPMPADSQPNVEPESAATSSGRRSTWGSVGQVGADWGTGASDPCPPPAASAAAGAPRTPALRTLASDAVVRRVVVRMALLRGDGRPAGRARSVEGRAGVARPGRNPPPPPPAPPFWPEKEVAPG